MEKNKPLVVFRADGHAGMGLGHLYRSSALAEMIRSRFMVALAYRYCPERTKVEFFDVFDHFVDLSNTKITEEADLLIVHGQKLAGNCKSFSVVLDGYHFNLDYQKVISAAKVPLVCIDDIYHQAYVADVIINHAGGVTPNNYVTKEATVFCLGPKFALLRSIFREPYRPLPRPAEGSIFICLGGSDPPNATLGILQQSVVSFPENLHDVVIGNANPHRSSLEEWITETEARVRLHIGLGSLEMACLMKASCIGITSPSTVSFEYLSVGGALYLQPIVDNQVNIYKYYIESGLAFSFENDFPHAGPDEISRSLHQREIIFDGKIRERYLTLFTELQTISHGSRV